jgi:hypothetical protein
MTNRIRSMLEQLEQTREDLLALSDDIWLSIDHNDPQALDEGVAFKRAYHAKLAAFDQLANDLSMLVQPFTAVRLDEPAAPGDQEQTHRARLIQDLDHRQPHGLDEDFTFKRPYGFQLDDESQVEVHTWRRLYELVCLYLARRDPERFAHLPENASLTSRRGNPGFSRDPLALRSAMALPSDVYAEVNLSANHLRDHVKTLLDVFAIEQTAMRIYLRQDRDAEVWAESRLGPIPEGAR